MISTTFLVTLALCLSPFSSGGKRNVLPIRSVGPKVGIGLNPDGLSSSLDMMETVGGFCFGEDPSDGPSGDPEEILSSEGPEDVESSPACGASLWLGVEDFLGLTDRIPSTNLGAEPPRDARDSGSARSHSTHLETSSSDQP